MLGINILKDKIMVSTHKIQEITFDKDYMHLHIDGKTTSLLLEKISPKLKAADDIKRAIYKISPSGYGIHWPLIDEDLSIEALLKRAT